MSTPRNFIGKWQLGKDKIYRNTMGGEGWGGKKGGKQTKLHKIGITFWQGFNIINRMHQLGIYKSRLANWRG